ncbi:hypothetical protein, partial [Streptomyces mirabilis]
FLNGALPFNGIMETVTRVVEEHGTPGTGTSLGRSALAAGRLGGGKTRKGPRTAGDWCRADPGQWCARS